LVELLMKKEEISDHKASLYRYFDRIVPVLSVGKADSLFSMALPNPNRDSVGCFSGWRSIAAGLPQKAAQSSALPANTQKLLEKKRLEHF